MQELERVQQLLDKMNETVPQEVDEVLQKLENAPRILSTFSKEGNEDISICADKHSYFLSIGGKRAVDLKVFDKTTSTLLKGFTLLLQKNGFKNR